MEELQSRHRKEQRELQSRITQKKKGASKKTRKGVNEECEHLEAELKEKQHAELAALNGGGEEGHHGDSSVDDAEDIILKTDGQATAIPEGNSLERAEEPSATLADNEALSQARKPNRQKARLARRAAEQEEAVRRAVEEAKDLPDLKEQERQRMLDAMEARGLQEKAIRADGHCLYSAFADQLEQLAIQPTITYKAVRAAAADYMELHQADFVPFLEEPLEQYLHKVRDTGEWGGQLELLALAKRFGVDVNVLQDFGRVERIGSGDDGKEGEVWLGYYKHGFGLGEHYNSLRRKG